MITRKLDTFRGLSSRKRRLALNAIPLVAFVRLGLWVAPFPGMQRICEKLGRLQSPADPAGPQEIAWAIRLASRYVPRATCLVQALATQTLLRRNGHHGQIHVGVAVDPKSGFRAHAWVECQGKVLVGGADEISLQPPLLVLDANGLQQQRKQI